MKKNILASRIQEKADTSVVLAEALGIPVAILIAKINEIGEEEFTQGDICKLIQRYGLSSSEVANIFF